MQRRCRGRRAPTHGRGHGIGCGEQCSDAAAGRRAPTHGRGHGIGCGEQCSDAAAGRRAPTHGHGYRSWFGLCGGPANSAAAGEWPSGTRCGRSRGSRPLCGCKKQRTDREIRLSGVLLGLYSRAGFSAAEIRFRVRQRRELGIERFRRVGLCTEESDAGTLQPGDVLPRTDADTASDVASNAATLPPGDVLPRTDADTASGVASNAATLPPGDVLPRTDTTTAVGLASAVGQPIPLRPVSGPSGTRCGRSRGSRPLCGCKKQRTDREIRLSGVLLGLYSRAGFSAAEIRFRVRQRRELGIERFRRVGLCTEESDAGTLQPGDVLPRTDTATAVGLASAVGQPIPLRPVSGPSGTRCGSRRGSRPLCGCKKQRTDREIRLSGALLRLYSRAGLSAAEIRFRVRQRRELGIERFRRVGLCTEESDAATLPPIHCPLSIPSNRHCLPYRCGRRRGRNRPFVIPLAYPSNRHCLPYRCGRRRGRNRPFVIP
ncbi:hypothetical protein NXY56_000513 [Leishmania guyanensis]